MTNQPLHFSDHIDTWKSLIGCHKPALIVDFDGTLSELKPDPSDAAIDPVCLTLLRKLDTFLPLIAVVSGRSVTDLKTKIQLKSVELYGNHGAEKFISGKYISQSNTEVDFSHISELLTFLKSEVCLPGLFFEDKTFSASVHYRISEDHDLVRKKLTEALRLAPNIDNLEIFWGREILEIRPTAQLNKGYAIQDIYERHQPKSMVFVGDDTTDIDGLAHLTKLRNSGLIMGLAVAVKSRSVNQNLLRMADTYVEDIDGVRNLLNWMLKNWSPDI